MKSQYLSINQIAKACSISRASILRMEEDGILTPAYINPENGYRYYDSTNVLRVVRNLTLKELGFTHKELKGYYDTPNNYQEMLIKLQKKMDMMEYYMANMRVQLKKEKHLSISHFYFPELYCYTYTLKNVKDLSSVRPTIWKVFNDALQDGFSIDIHMRPFVLVDYVNIEANQYQNIGYDYEICIPVMPNQNKEKLKYFPATDTVSTILYGGAKDMPKAICSLIDTISQCSSQADSQARVIAVVNSYPGEDIPLDYWVLRACIPIH